MTDKCYSLDGETFFGDFVDILYESDEELKPGDTYYEADRIQMSGEMIVSKHEVGRILETLDASAYEELGEMPSMPFEDIDPEAMEALRQLIVGWVDKHTKLSEYFVIKNPVEKTFTKEDLE